MKHAWLRIASSVRTLAASQVETKKAPGRARTLEAMRTQARSEEAPMPNVNDPTAIAKRCALFLLFCSALLVPVVAYQPKPERLFDGKTLKGWEGNLKVFRVEEGAIVGGTMKETLDHNEFLCTTKEYGDFEMRVKFKLTGDPAKVNGGVQFRSQRIPNNHEVIGYQADLGQNYWGSLYDESRRKKTLAGPNLDELFKVLKRDDWNEYLIRAEGKHIRLSINGFQTVDYTEPEEGIAARGQICVQIHAGPPSEARYKDISIQPLGR
jgi:hypothetical protein